MVRLIDLVLVVVRKLLGNQENRKAKNSLSPKNWLSQEKSCQKVEIHLILMLKRIT